MTNNLNLLEDYLNNTSVNLKEKNYIVPGIWVSDALKGEDVKVEPNSFFAKKIREIKEIAKNINKPKRNLTSSESASVYNLFIRYNLSYDHYLTGEFSHKSEKHFRQTGTFLKAIAILPYLYSMGINTIYLLPISSISHSGKKGDAGSPYAKQNPYSIENTLGETNIRLNAEEQFSAFVEAAHLLGMKVVLEFVFRTAGLDSDLAINNPEWFYWIYEEHAEHFRPPAFTESELNIIQKKIESNDFENLLQPNERYRKMFSPTPVKVHRINGEITGETAQGQKVVIPSAFADWPPNDTQPLWSDVTYLKIYDSPDYNYMAYNTVRMYDDNLAKDEYEVTSLWENIAGIVPHYINKFNIDGIMIDMGHALPSKLRTSIIKKAKELKPDFIFWEENFVLSEKSKADGYNASLGYMPFDQHVPYKFKQIVRMFEENRCPIDFFATPETHNTPRTASRLGNSHFSKLAYTLNAFLPTINFIHSGFELSETYPVNTGLGFSESDYNKYPQDVLPLFSNRFMNWNNPKEIIEHIRKISRLRYNYLTKNKANSADEIKLINNEQNAVIAYTRKISASGNTIIVIGNLSEMTNIDNLNISNEFDTLKDLISESVYQLYDGSLRVTLNPFEYIIGLLK